MTAVTFTCQSRTNFDSIKSMLILHENKNTDLHDSALFGNENAPLPQALNKQITAYDDQANVETILLTHKAPKLSGVSIFGADWVFGAQIHL